MAYAGDLTPRDAWDLLQNEAGAQLVDVRTQPEWSLIGIPNLTALNKQVHLLSWQTYPTMAVDPQFVEKLSDRVPDADTPLLFLCRTGGRSRAAAMAMTQAGYRRCYNVADGFEGGVDKNGHRGVSAGWKAEQLPWVQD